MTAQRPPLRGGLVDPVGQGNASGRDSPQTQQNFEVIGVKWSPPCNFVSPENSSRGLAVPIEGSFLEHEIQ